MSFSKWERASKELVINTYLLIEELATINNSYIILESSINWLVEVSDSDESFQHFTNDIKGGSKLRSRVTSFNHSGDDSEVVSLFADTMSVVQSSDENI
jgi:hypothetical protein